LIASVYLPSFIWLAVGSLSNLTPDKCLALKDRKVVLYPDLNANDKWKGKAEAFKSFADFTVSDLLEKQASDDDKTNGLDLADYLLGCV
jgi:hypothetical protein